MDNNIPQVKVKAIKGIIDLSNTHNISDRTDHARKIYSKHETQSMLQRFVRAITGRNKREELDASDNIAIAVEHLNQLTKQLSDEVASNGKRTLENTNSISLNARAITKLSNNFISLLEDHETFKDQFKEFISKQKEYNKFFQNAINGLELQQYIDRLYKAWENKRFFQGYHPIIQAFLFIDCIYQNWGDVLVDDQARITYLKDIVCTTLTRLYPESESLFKYKQGNFQIDSTNNLEILQDELQIYLSADKQNHAGFLTYKAINNNIPDWFNLNPLETNKTLVQALITEAGEN